MKVTSIKTYVTQIILQLNLEFAQDLYFVKPDMSLKYIISFSFGNKCKL